MFAVAVYWSVLLIAVERVAHTSNIPMPSSKDEIALKLIVPPENKLIIIQ